MFKRKGTKRFMDLPEACLFDLDGVLLDTESLHGQAWSHTASAFGTKLSKSQLMMLRGRRRLDCAEQIIRWLKKSISIDELLSIHQPIAKKLLSQTTEMSGAKDLVQWCSSHQIPTALVTSSTSESVALKSLPHSWLNLISTRVLGDDPDLSAGKPGD